MTEISGVNHNLLTPPILDLSSEGNLQSSWRSWLEKWRDFAVVTSLHKKTTQYRCSMLRYCFADSTRAIYNTLDLNCVERNDPDKIIYALGKFVDDSVNHPRHRYNFHSRMQKSGESFHTFITDLRKLALKCNFCDECKENSICDQIVVGVNDKGVRQKLLECNKLTAKRAEEVCRAAEKTRLDSKAGRNTFIKARKGLQPCCEGVASRKKWDPDTLSNRKTSNCTDGSFFCNRKCENGMLCRKKSFKRHSDSERYETDEVDSGLCTPGDDVTCQCNEFTYDENRISPAKQSVKVVRRMITKCRESKNHILKGLQILRNTDKTEEKYASISEKISKKQDNRSQPIHKAETSTPRMSYRNTTMQRESRHTYIKNQSQENPSGQPGERTLGTHVSASTLQNGNNINGTSASPKNPQESQTLIADATSRIFLNTSGHRHVTPRDLIEETVTELKGRKVSDETFMEHYIPTCDELDSLPYDDEDEDEEELNEDSDGDVRSFNDRTTCSSFSNRDDLSDTFEYDYDSQESGGVKIGKTEVDSRENSLGAVKIEKAGAREDDEDNWENEEYVLTTYM